MVPACSFPASPRRPAPPARVPLSGPCPALFRVLALVGLALVLASPFSSAPAAASPCEPSSPATPVPAFLWPPTLQPAVPGQTLPARRDSTQYLSFGYPGYQDGHELYSGVDVLDGYLFVAYNAGLQVWDIRGQNAADPALLVVRDGWMGSFLEFQGQPSEHHIFLDEVVALRESPTTILVAASGRLPRAGISLWRFHTETLAFDPLYQNPGADAYQVRLARLDGRILLVVAHLDGVRLYDAERAAELAPCLEDPLGLVELCPGVALGRLGNSERSLFVDTLEVGNRLWISSSDGNGNSSVRVELWSLEDPDSPGSARLLGNDLDRQANGTALFEHDGHYYLAAVHGQGMANRFGIFSLDSCLSGPCSYGFALARKSLLPFTAQQYLSFSRSHGDPFLYYGGLFSQLGGAGVEMLLDLRPLRPDHSNIELPELASGGPTYFDTCTGVEVDYWGWYYSRNESGLRNFAPRRGKFHGNYFYRAAVGILDVHRRTAVESSPGIFLDGFETGGTDRWTGASLSGATELEELAPGSAAPGEH